MSLENSIIGKEFTCNGNNVVILDEVIIDEIDAWKAYITIITTIGNISFEIIDYNTYYNHKSIGMLNNDKIKNLLPNVFNKIATFKEFKGNMTIGSGWNNEVAIWLLTKIK